MKGQLGVKTGTKTEMVFLELGQLSMKQLGFRAGLVSPGCEKLSSKIYCELLKEERFTWADEMRVHLESLGLEYYWDSQVVELKDKV